MEYWLVVTRKIKRANRNKFWHLLLTKGLFPLRSCSWSLLIGIISHSKLCELIASIRFEYLFRCLAPGFTRNGTWRTDFRFNDELCLWVEKDSPATLHPNNLRVFKPCWEDFSSKNETAPDWFIWCFQWNKNNFHNLPKPLFDHFPTTIQDQKWRGMC